MESDFKMIWINYMRRSTFFKVILILLISSSLCNAQNSKACEIGATRQISFAGYEWKVKSGYFYPGENYWDEKNVWVDDKGYLHMKISQHEGKWYCAEISTIEEFGFGSYQFRVIDFVDKLDPNIVVGLFVYQTHETRNGQINEIDIEFSHWGREELPIGNYTVTPVTQPFGISLAGNYTLHQFDWRHQDVFFQSFHGHIPQAEEVFSQWLYKPEQYHRLGPVPPVRVHLNLWLYGGKAPQNGQEREIIIRDFTFTPLNDSTLN